MKKIGQWQQLEILRFTSVGAYLNALDESSESDVLLPAKYLNDELELGQMLEVFLYRDSEDRMIATLEKPKAVVGDIALLKVVDIHKIGAFLDWGLSKDLLLPQDQWKREVHKGELVLVYLYLDSSDRIVATMKIESQLRTDSNYQVGDSVKGTVYSIAKDIGVFVAVDNCYLAMIPAREVVDDYQLGQAIEARITKIHSDGKIVLATREKTSLQIHSDVALIKEKLKNNQGFLSFNDKSAPDLIRAEFKMSKKAFKRAIGVLLKEKYIEQTEKGITIKSK